MPGVLIGLFGSAVTRNSDFAAVRDCDHQTIAQIERQALKKALKRAMGIDLKAELGSAQTGANGVETYNLGNKGRLDYSA